jgi:segregation and condensation protein B
VTTKQFLSAFGLETLRDLPDIERLEDAGLLSRQAMDLANGFGEAPSEDDGADMAS